MTTIRPLSKELQEVAAKEINEDPKRIKNDIEIIRQWLSQQKYITARTDDQTIVTFLRGCKYSLEKTKEKIDMYHTLKTITPELYDKRDPLTPELQEILSLGIVLPLKQADPTGPCHTLVRNGLYDPSKISHANVFKLSLMVQEILFLESDNLAVAGTVVVQDMKNCTMGFGLSFSPTLVKKTLYCIQQVYPTRIKGVHFFNVSPAFEIINNLFRQFVSEKIRDRIKVYSADKMDELYKTVPKSILPVEYGGEGGTIEELTAFWKAKVESYRQWFLDDEQYRTDEKKRPGKPKTSDTIFGIDGSFRKLDVD